MEDAIAYMKGTAPASEGMFKLLNDYGWQKVRAFVALTKSKTRHELEEHNRSFSSTDIAREVLLDQFFKLLMSR